MKRYLPVMALVTTAVIGLSYSGWSSSVGAQPTVPHPSAVALDQASTVDRRELSRLIDEFERQVKDRPTATSLNFLAQMYLQRGRLTGDVATYVQAQVALQQAVRLAPLDVESRTLLASVLATTHDFAGAAREAGALASENPTDVAASAVLGDAQLELGAYADAAQTYGRLYADAPDSAAVIVRQARLAFLQGGVHRAERLANDAKDKALASAFGDAGLAFYTTFQAQLAHDTGHYDRAADLYSQALREAPGYYIALAGLARERAAQGRIDDAIKTYEQAVAAVPQPDAVAALGDLYRLRGDAAKAKIEYDTVGAIATLAAINKQVYNRALAVYDADHDVNVDEAVRLAQTELSVRQDVYGYDAVAWALYKAGRYTDAKDAATKALAQNTPDARLLYHAGMVDKALGHLDAARTELRRALAISPKFDPVQAPIARAALADLDHATAGAHS